MRNDEYPRKTHQEIRLKMKRAALPLFLSLYALILFMVFIYFSFRH